MAETVYDDEAPKPKSELVPSTWTDMDFLPAVVPMGTVTVTPEKLPLASRVRLVTLAAGTGIRPILILHWPAPGEPVV
jgi:hypothetical protein